MICLPSSIVDSLKTKLKDGTITPDRLSSMSPDERHAFLGYIVGKEHATEVNALIESKLRLKDQQRGLITAMNELLGNKHPAARSLLDRVNKMTDILSPTDENKFYKDLAATKLGLRQVTAEEAQHITDLAKKVSDLKGQNPKMSGVSDEYLKARHELTSYTESLKPLSWYKSIGRNLEVIARNNLLLNPSTPIKTAIGHVENTVLDAVTRRISTFSLRADNPDLAAKANKEAWETFKKTGNNTAAMENLDDTHVLGKGESFGLPKGTDEGAIAGGLRKIVGGVAKISNKIAIHWEHNYAFTKFYQKTFFDSANIFSSQIAKQEGLSGDALASRSAEILKDASRIEPQTDEGKMVRIASQKQASRITSTNETWLSTLALGVKRAMNSALPGSGDILMPIAKIPANLIANSLDNAGVGLPKGIIDIWKGHEAMQSEDLQSKMEGAIQFREGLQRVGRIVGTTAIAALIANQFQRSDFRTDNYGNHFFKLGNLWINTEYLSIISLALAGFMMAKEKGTDFSSDIYQYGAGVASGLKSIPAITGIGTEIFAQGLQKYGTQFLESRLSPTILKSLFSKNPLFKTFFGSGVETTQQYQTKVEQQKKARAAKAKATRIKNRGLPKPKK